MAIDMRISQGKVWMSHRTDRAKRGEIVLIWPHLLYYWGMLGVFYGLRIA